MSEHRMVETPAPAKRTTEGTPEAKAREAVHPAIWKTILEGLYMAKYRDDEDLEAWKRDAGLPLVDAHLALIEERDSLRYTLRETLEGNKTLAAEIARLRDAAGMTLDWIGAIDLSGQSRLIIEETADVVVALRTVLVTPKDTEAGDG